MGGDVGEPLLVASREVFLFPVVRLLLGGVLLVERGAVAFQSEVVLLASPLLLQVEVGLHALDDGVLRLLHLFEL